MLTPASIGDVPWPYADNDGGDDCHCRRCRLFLYVAGVIFTRVIERSLVHIANTNNLHFVDQSNRHRGVTDGDNIDSVYKRVFSVCWAEATG